MARDNPFNPRRNCQPVCRSRVETGPRAICKNFNIEPSDTLSHPMGEGRDEGKGSNIEQPRRSAGLRIGCWMFNVGCSMFPALLLCSHGALAAENSTALPPPADRTVIFDTDIRPILEQSCLRCHGPERPKSGFRLDNRESALEGGYNNTNNIVPGSSAGSLLVHYTARLVEDMEMPPPGKGDPLTPEQISLLRAWIDQGADWGTSMP